MRKKELMEFPLGYWEEQSYMMVIPAKKEEDLLKKALTGISSMKEVTVKKNYYNIEKNCTSFIIQYENEEYEIGIYDGGISVPEYYLNWMFTEEEKNQILKAEQALTIFMKFNENPKKCYHLQLKLALAMVPDFIGVLDESAEKMLPARWVKMTAESKVLPSSKHLFSVQAVIGDNKKVWLHTHGLCRCNMTELEILESDEEHQQNHYNLLNVYAMYLLDRKEQTDPRLEGAYIGRLINGYPIVVTCVSWTKGILEYKKLKLGGLEDRREGHHSKTSIIFIYQNEKEEKKKIFSKVSVYDKLWGENPLFFFSDEETARMKALAQERFCYVEDSIKKKENQVLIKIGLYSKQEQNFEHIWFELLEIKGNQLKARLTQEPYYFDNLHTGDEDWYMVEDITDWIIYTPVANINPDNAFLLEKE